MTCLRCGRGDLFRPIGPDIQTPDIWLCVHCDQPERYREIERRASRAAVQAPEGTARPITLPHRPDAPQRALAQAAALF
jgi:hypothetical protein